MRTCIYIYIYTVTVAAYKSIISVCANAKVRIPVSSQYPCSVELAHTYSCMDTHACHLNVKVYIDWGRVSNTAKGPDSPGTPKESKLLGRGPPCSGNLQTPPKVRPNNWGLTWRGSAGRVVGYQNFICWRHADVSHLKRLFLSTRRRTGV